MFTRFVQIISSTICQTLKSYVPQRCFVETCYLVGWCSALPTFQGRTWLMCYTVGSKLLKKLCCDSVLKPSEEVIWRKVPPNNPVSMQLSALQKLEVVSHADCRACLFTSKHSNDWWSVLPETSFKDAPGYDLLYLRCIVPQCGIAFLIGGSMIMWQWATKIHLDREYI